MCLFPKLAPAKCLNLSSFCMYMQLIWPLESSSSFLEVVSVWIISYSLGTSVCVGIDPWRLAKSLVRLFPQAPVYLYRLLKKTLYLLSQDTAKDIFLRNLSIFNLTASTTKFNIYFIEFCEIFLIFFKKYFLNAICSLPLGSSFAPSSTIYANNSVSNSTNFSGSQQV